MARSYGRFTTDIWRDQKFRSLTLAEQWVYFMLGTQTDISAAGMLPLTEKRWAGYASDATPDALSDALSGLVSKRFVVVDDDTQELLVRAFAKWDGGLGNRNRRPVVLDAIRAIASPLLRHVMALELRDMGEPEAEWEALSDAGMDAAWHARTDAASDADRTSDRVVVTTVGKSLQPTTPKPQPATPVPAPRNGRASRIPTGWKPSASDVAWATERGIPIEMCRYEFEKFTNFWTAKSGKDATKADWSATWKNWMLRAAEQSPGLNRGKGAATSKAEGWLALAEQHEDAS